MDATPIIFILFGIVLIVAVIFAGVASSKRDRRRIQDHLSEQGATDIVISRE